MNTSCILVSSPLSKICIENTLYLREKLVFFSLVLRVMGGEGKARIGQCGSLWGKKAGLGFASPDSSVTKSLQQGAAETGGQILGPEAKDHRVAVCLRPEGL